LEKLLSRLGKETKMKSGVENMLEVYIKDKKRTKELEAQLEGYNRAIDQTTKRIEQIRTTAGKHRIKQEVYNLYAISEYWK
jgi:prefoldin subunit 5